MVQGAAFTVISPGLGVLSPVSDMKFAPAMSAAEETRQQSFSTTDRSARHKTLAVSVIGDQDSAQTEITS